MNDIRRPDPSGAENSLPPAEQSAGGFPSFREPKAVTFFGKKRPWLNGLLFVVTVASCFFVGITWSVNYVYADTLGQDVKLSIGLEVLKNPEVIALSLIYAVVLISILLAHEMGHYLTCRYYGIDATLPYFIPAPTLIGTMGAFIKIRSPITKKHQLFDVGIAGPLAGFVLALPAMVYGLSLSKVISPLPSEGSIVFGEPLLFKVLSGMMFKGLPENFDMILHPVAFAGWVGILVTALNLFPIGQLDGGHIVYAVFGQKSRAFGRPILLIFIVMGLLFWIGWFVWALLIGIIGLKHPRLFDEEIPISSGRRLLAFVVVIIFILSFIPDPVKGFTLFDLLRGGGLSGG
ncbi:MAG: site-2 protease family protein [Candidatus Aminicenantes bacterium]|nr:site-2 protease family protein [Candidatus Aminicenantes bacterium]